MTQPTQTVFLRLKSKLFMTPTEVQQVVEQEMNAYTTLFNFFWDEHNLTLLHSEMDDIIKACDHFKKNV